MPTPDYDSRNVAPSAEAPSPAPDPRTMTDEQRYGPATFRARRWRRIVNCLDDNVPRWRAPQPYHTVEQAARFLGDYAVVALSRLAEAPRELQEKLDAQLKSTTELADKYHALKHSLAGSAFNALSYQLTGANDKVRALEEELAMSRKAISSLAAQRLELKASLEAASRRGNVAANFRRSKDKRWEGSYTKRVVDELKKRFPLTSIVAAAQLLEDYHTTHHEVWERAEQLEKDATAQYGSENWRRFGAPRSVGDS